MEGQTATGALSARAGIHAPDLETIARDHPVWDSAVHALSCLCVNLILTVSPDRIVLSGGVMQNKTLFPRIRVRTLELLAGYVQRDSLLNKIDEYITPSVWDNDAGIVGALTLSMIAHNDATA